MDFRSLFWGVILIVVGSFFLIEELTPLSVMNYFWPSLFIVAGGLLLLKNRINDNPSNHPY